MIRFRTGLATACLALGLAAGLRAEDPPACKIKNSSSSRVYLTLADTVVSVGNVLVYDDTGKTLMEELTNPVYKGSFAMMPNTTYKVVIVPTPKISMSVQGGKLKGIALTLGIKRDGTTVKKVNIKQFLFENDKGELKWVLPDATLADIKARIRSVYDTFRLDTTGLDKLDNDTAVAPQIKVLPGDGNGDSVTVDPSAYQRGARFLGGTFITVK